MFLLALFLTLFGCSIAYWTMTSISKPSYSRPLIFNNSITVIIISVLWTSILVYGLYLFWKVNSYIPIAFCVAILLIFLTGIYLGNVRVRARRVFKIYKIIKANFPQLDARELYRQTAISYYKSIKWKDEKINMTVDYIFNNGDNIKADGLTDFARTVLIFEDPSNNSFENGFDVHNYMAKEDKIDKSIQKAFEDTFKAS